MKNFICSLSFVIIYSFSFLVAHQQGTHQYLTQEAYSLLKLSLNSDIQPMLEHLHTTFPAEDGGPWQLGYLTRGAYREDEEDPIYNYYSGNHPALYGNAALTVGLSSTTILTILQEVLNVNWDPFVSSTHFWNPDGGDFTQTTMRARSLTTDFYFMIPNAYQKMINYANGGWDLNVNLILYGFPTQGDGTGSCATQRAIVTFRYNSLKDLYLNKNLYVRRVVWLDGSETVYNNPIRFTSSHWSLLNDNTWDFFMNNMPWEILGRMCHLLQDMSVAAHVHIDEHGPFSRGDSYESYMGSDRYWTGSQVFNLPVGMMEPYVSSNPLHYLMYTTAQMADHFGTDGPYEGDGDNIISGNYSSEEMNFLNMINLANLGGQTGMKSPLDNQELIAERDVLVPQAIRATAGLLYWFAVETGLVNRIIIKNNFNAGTIKFNNEVLQSGTGKSFMSGQTSTLTAIPQSYNSYNYIWNTVGLNTSKWEKFDKNNIPQPISNNFNTTYNLISGNNENAIYVAGLRKNYVITTHHQTEFDGILSNQSTVYIVEQNSGTVSAPSTKTVGSRTYNFAGWAGSNGYSSSFSITPTDNASYTALYKTTNYSNSTIGFSNSSQKKLVRTDDGNLHKVYTSMGRVWYEISSDNGSTWQIANGGMPLDVLEGKHPSIDYSPSGSSYSNNIVIVFQENNNGDAGIKTQFFQNGVLKFQSSFIPNPIAADPYSYDLVPVISFGYAGRVIVVWRQYGLLYRLGQVTITDNQFYWYNTGTVIPNTDAGSRVSSIACRNTFPTFHLAWEQSYSSIRYSKLTLISNATAIQVSDYADISPGGGFPVVYLPSIAVNSSDYPYVVWTGTPYSGTSYKAVVMRQKSSSGWSSVFGQYDDMADNPVITATDDGSSLVPAWSYNSGSNTKCLRYGSIKSFNVPGLYIQLANAPNLNSMFAAAYQVQSAPYSFTTTPGVGSIAKAVNTACGTGRSVIFTKDSMQIYYALGDVKLNGEPVLFIETGDSLIISEETDVNKYLPVFREKKAKG